MKILIITGGNSSERKVSLVSARNVESALLENGHKATIFDLKSGYEKINDIAQDFDVLFPVLHGEEGEGGKLHKFLSSINKPIVGTRNYKNLDIAWHKTSFKKYCRKFGIKTAPWKIIKNNYDILNFGFPCVLKTSDGGSSKEVVILNDESDFNKFAFRKIMRLKSEKFVERYLSGIEATVGILDKKALPVLEIVPPDGAWFSFEFKYDGSTKEIPFAPSLSEDKQKKVQEIALKIHKEFDLGTYSRSDFIICNNEIYALEVNTIPGLTAESLMPKATLAAGISFNEFLEILLRKSQ